MGDVEGLRGRRGWKRRQRERPVERGERGRKAGYRANGLVGV